MRDDRLGGARQLAEVLEHLDKNNLVHTALAEKAEAVRLWRKSTASAQEIHWPDADTGAFAKTSAAYGLRLFRVVEAGWRVMAWGIPPSARGRAAGGRHCGLRPSVDCYQETAHLPNCSTLYLDRYFNLPGCPPVAGLAETVNIYRANLKRRSSEKVTAR